MSNFVSQASLKMLASSFILSRLDYCNSLLQYLPQVQTNRLQKLQNHAARIICRRPIRDHVTPLLVYLHWLPVTARIDYKILTLVYKCKHGLAPDYLSTLIESYQPVRTLRSSTANLLTVSTVAKNKKNWETGLLQ